MYDKSMFDGVVLYKNISFKSELKLKAKRNIGLLIVKYKNRNWQTDPKIQILL